MSTTPIRIALVDDHQLFRKGVAALLEKMENVQLVLEASNGREFLDALSGTPIELVLLDLKMPVLDGRNTLEILQRTHPNIKVLFLTMDTRDETILQCMEQGAHGFLAKDAHPDEVRNAINSVHNTGIYINQETSAIMRQGLGAWNAGQRATGVKLNEKEMQVLKGICLQQSTAEIAEQLFVSPRTVEGYRRTMLDKTEAKNSIGLVLFAVRNGWLEKWLNAPA